MSRIVWVAALLIALLAVAGCTGAADDNDAHAARRAGWLARSGECRLQVMAGPTRNAGPDACGGPANPLAVGIIQGSRHADSDGGRTRHLDGNIF